MTDRQKEKLAAVVDEIDAKLEHSDAVVVGRTMWRELKRAANEALEE